MKNFTKFMIASICGLATILPSEVSAFQENPGNGCYAESVIAFEQGPKIGSGSIAVDRSNPNVALGEPDRSNTVGGFVSLGDGGSITLQFAGAIFDSLGDDIMVYETSYSGDVCGKSDDETAEIYLSQDGSTWVSYGEICRDAAIDINGLGLDYVTQIKIVSTATTPDGYDVDGVEAINGCQDVPQDTDPVCNEFVMYLADSKSFEYTTKLYTVNFNGGNADLTLLTTLDYRSHIAYNSDENVIYSVYNGGSKFETLDAMGNKLSTTNLSPDLGSIPAAVYHNGKLYVGSQTQNKVVEVDVASGTYVDFATDVPVSGGDLVVKNGTIYLVTRSGDKLYKIEAGSATLVGDIAGGVNGASTTEDDQIITSNTGSSKFKVIDDLGNTVASYPVRLNGEAFTMFNGDMASGCNIQASQDPEPVCYGFRTYLADSKSFEYTTKLYTVNFVGSNADLTLLTTLDYRSHIAYNSEENVIYSVYNGGSKFETLDDMGNKLSTTNLSPDLGAIPAAVYHNGKLYLGSQTQSKVVEVDIATGNYVDFATDVPVSGGDLVVKNGSIYLVTRSGDKLYKIEAGSATLVGDIAGGVNGASTTEDDQIITSNTGSNRLKVIDDSGSTVASYLVRLNGEAFTMFNGDMASGGCSTSDNEPNECVTAFVNGSFEDDNTFFGAWSYVSQDEVPGWSTTSATGTIEIQKSGLVDGNASNAGDYHFELNGDGLNNIYQEVCTTPGSNIAISFAHKKRQAAGVDKMELYIGDVLADIESNTALPYIANSDMAWHSNTFVYTVPSGQTSTFIYFKAVSGTTASLGNLLDNIAVSVTTDPATDVDVLSTKAQEMISSEITMFPVPATNKLTVKLTRTLAANSVSYEIVSILGQTYNRGTFDVKSGQTEISEDISRLADGSYFFVLNVDGTTTTKQFVKTSR